MKNYYNFLGLEINASPEEIKKAYRKLSLKFHPDKNDGDKFFEDRFKQINEAYETLSNPDKKAAYDKQLFTFFHSSQANTFTEEEVRAYAEKIRREYEEKLRQERAKHTAYNNTNRQSHKHKQEPPKQQQSNHNTKSKQPHQAKPSGNGGWAFMGLLLMFLCIVIGIAASSSSKTEEDKIAEIQEGIRLFNSNRYTESFALLTQYTEASFFTDEAEYCLGYMYGEGLGTPEDDATANRIMTNLSLSDNTEYSHWADYYLGFQYYNGEGTGANSNIAYDKFIKAARNEIPGAMLQVAKLYHTGDGTYKDFKKAKYWYEKAAENDIVEAKEALNGADFKVRITHKTSRTTPSYNKGQTIRVVETGTLWDQLNNSKGIKTVHQGDLVELIETETGSSVYYYVKYKEVYGYLNVLSIYE